MNLARKNERIATVPYFPMVREDNARKGFVEESDFLRFLAELSDCMKAFAAVAYYGGLRRGELIRLELADIDLARRVIELRETKNGEARIVPILDGPMLQWLQWSDQHKHHGQVMAFCSGMMADRSPFATFTTSGTRPRRAPAFPTTFRMTRGALQIAISEIQAFQKS